MSAITTETGLSKTIRLTNGNTFTYTSNAATTAETIPLIDVSRMFSESKVEREALAEEIREAARSIGFFYMVNHVRCGDNCVPKPLLTYDSIGC